MRNILINALQRRLKPSSPSRKDKQNSKSTNAIRLSKGNLFLIRVVIILLVAISAYFYAYGISYYKAVLELGFIGAFCEECNNAATGISLIVIPRSPADEQGLQTGDVLLEVNGKAVDNRRLPTGIDEPWGLFGAAGSPLSVTVKRDDQLKMLDLHREKGWNENVTLGLRILNLSESASIFLALFVEITIIVVFFGSGLFLFLSRSNELMVMLTSATLILAGFIFTRSIIYFPNSPAKYIYSSLINFALPTLFLFFPNGKLISRKEYIFILSYFFWQVYFGFTFSEGNHYTK